MEENSGRGRHEEKSRKGEDDRRRGEIEEEKRGRPGGDDKRTLGQKVGRRRGGTW